MLFQFAIVQPGGDIFIFGSYDTDEFSIDYTLKSAKYSPIKIENYGIRIHLS
jgi:hypothetical protein